MHLNGYANTTFFYLEVAKKVFWISENFHFIPITKCMVFSFQIVYYIYDQVYVFHIIWKLDWNTLNIYMYTYYIVGRFCFLFSVYAYKQIRIYHGLFPQKHYTQFANLYVTLSTWENTVLQPRIVSKIHGWKIAKYAL